MRRLLVFFAATAICVLGATAPAALRSSSALLDSPTAKIGSTSAAILSSALLGSAPASARSRTACVSAAKATYRHTFDGAAGTATITAAQALCRHQSQTFSLVSYTAPARSQPGGLFVYATAHATIDRTHRSVTLKVAVPACSTQVYAYFGRQVTNETTTAAPLYGSSRLGAAGSRSVGKFGWFTGGGTPCDANPIATFTSACDNIFTATLTNPANANADAVFVRSGTLTRVAPGRSVRIAAKKGATVTLRASNFSTYIGTWRQPSAPCFVPGKSTPTVAAPAATIPPAPAVAASTAAASAPSAFSTEVDDVVTPPAAGWSTSSPAAAGATASESGMSAGSMVAIGVGFLLMGCGVALLRRVIRTARNPA